MSKKPKSSTGNVASAPEAFIAEKASVCQEAHQNLTKIEREVYHLLINEYLTPKQIANRRETTTRAVRMHIQKIKEKGLISEYNKILPFSQCGMEETEGRAHQIRLHGIEFNIQILYKDDRYKQIIEKKGNILLFDGDTVRLYDNSIEVYMIKSFFGVDASSALRSAFDYCNRLFLRLESDLKIIFVKPRVANIRMVKSHFSEVNNEFARDCGDKHEKIGVLTREDGKLWFLVDNSFNLHEAETVHSRTGKDDMQVVVQPFFNDLRANKGLILSDVAKSMVELVEMQKVSQMQLKTLIDAMQFLVSVPQQSGERDKKLDNYIG